MSRQARLALAILAGAAIVAALLILLKPTPDKAPRDQGAPLVQALALGQSNRPLVVNASGTVQPSEEVAVSAQVSGRLVYVNPRFREGSLVQSGATLFRIDPADYRNRVRSAQADVAAQQVGVLQAREEARIAKEELDQFANRQRANAPAPQTPDANDHDARILPPRELAGNTAIPAQGSANQQPGVLATREPQLRSAKAARDRAAAQLADAKLALSRTGVRAPFSGLVRSESAALGKLVQPGDELGSIVSASAYEVRVSLTEREAALIPGLLKPGTARIPATVLLDYGGQTYRWNARVDRADSILDPQTRTIDVFLKVSNPLNGGVNTNADGNGTAPPLLLGSFVRAEITGGTDEPFVQVPVESLRAGNTIWVARDGRLRILPVRVLQRTDRRANVVVPAMKPDDRIVTSPLRAPVDGMQIRSEKKTQQRPAAPAKASSDD